MATPDYYSVLGVPSTASPDQIERAYKLLARMSHPDAFPNDPRGQAWANERMKRINEAYSVLRDPATRAEYDRSTVSAAPPEETAEPATQRLRCPLCEGDGRTVCLTCQGRGNPDCPGCGGRYTVTCPACGGLGNLSADDYERLVEELNEAESRTQQSHSGYAARSASQRGSHDPFWQVGYWDRPQERLQVKLPPAPVLSLFLPGAGQFYNREPQKGLTYLGIAFLLFLGIGLLKGVGVLIWLGFWAYNVYDAYSTAERLRH